MYVEPFLAVRISGATRVVVALAKRCFAIKKKIDAGSISAECYFF